MINGDPKKIIKINNDLAYLIGLLASDGCLDSDKYKIHFVTKDIEQITNYVDIIHEEVLNYKINWLYRKDGCYYYSFTSELFYKFCIGIGLTPKKSLTIKELNIPEIYFADFLRGEIDGDGCIHQWYYKTKNGKKIIRLKVSIYSGSYKFLEWIKNKTYIYYGVNCSSVMKRDNCYSIVYGHNASLKLCEIIYKKPKFYLTRKKVIAEHFFSPENNYN